MRAIESKAAILQLQNADEASAMPALDQATEDDQEMGEENRELAKKERLQAAKDVIQENRKKRLKELAISYANEEMTQAEFIAEQTKIKAEEDAAQAARMYL